MMVSYFAFALLMLIFGVLKLVFRLLLQRRGHSRRVLRRCRAMLAELAQQERGRVYETRHRRLIYTSQTGDVDVEIQSSSRPRIKIRVNTPFRFRAAFYRIPTLAYAFLEAFIRPGMRIGNLPYFVATSSPDEFARMRAAAGFEALLEQLSDSGFSVRMGQDGVTLWKYASPGELYSAWFSLVLRRARNFAEICRTGWIVIPVQAVESERRCGYCREPVEEGQAISYCALCGTPHHEECFRLNGRCTVYGCSSSRPAEDEPTRLVS